MMMTLFGTVMRKSGKIKESFRELSSMAGGSAKLKNVASQLQEAALDERCILVDYLDRPVGEATKRYCHLVDERGRVPLHRAFSVFLFDGKGNLLLQKRASSKITFPGYWANTCCSHPLTDIPGESDEHLALGVKKAAQRRLNYELGIPKNEFTLEDLNYITRIHYHYAGNEKWGEHEIDYVLFLQKDQITIRPNPDEISEIRWVSKDRIQEFVDNVDEPLSPWFHLILKHKLLLWWEHLGNLESVKDTASIHKLA